ncbi:FMN-binding protein [Tetragenococcus koreensis]|uniref:FMN-binding domain-containing protein n=1 Tax=Tetragenococcus koreensis TaxID=290335 RepID=A0AAN4UAF6_9ENTE|nr:extracellular electron transfer flavoprotein PplA [Tetragenococcus koreensis]MDN6507394.1 FMN-binding protein [Tetragenococcus halophilus]AYW46256.1 FMN-binding protein [Tetragenococcus koreensis]MCF1585041.1 FMN-binding protein [Tetragenococcus koreensis]MCF1614604.1 FMN-binding protein [Tetragenococcus koreensis]MCF1617119.1 FMN-binding protein [Tetragenococcus koreensis]
MKTKKFMTGFAALAFSTIVLGACSADNADEGNDEGTSQTSTKESSSEETEAVSGASMQDGTYSLKELNDNNGYHVEFSITTENGEITESNYDYVNADGESKQDDDEYNEQMEEEAGIAPEEFIPQLNEELENEQNPENVEVVSGATHSSHSFQNYAQQLVQAAQEGNTDEIEIDNGADLQDGTYTLEEKNYSNGYRTVFSIEVEDGKITESDFDNVDEDGNSKKDDEEYNEAMEDEAGVGPDEYIDTLNDELVETMDDEEAAPGDVEVVSGATHSSESFVLYAEQLVNAAEKGDTDTIEVDNYVEE